MLACIGALLGLLLAFAGTRASSTAIAMTLFAIIAAVGIYAVVSFGVTERTRETGVRVALGAGHRQVRWLVVRQAPVPVLAGGLVGFAAALLASYLQARRASPSSPTPGRARLRAP